MKEKSKQIGRPRIDPDTRRVAFTVALPHWLWLKVADLEGSRGRLVEYALVKTYGLKKGD